MQKHNHVASPLRGAIYTLAQNGTGKATKAPLIVQGNGSDLSNSKALKGRAKRKVITQAMALNLVDIAKAKGDDEKVKGYWNTYYCQNKVQTVEGRLHGKYCKNRFCTLCSCIRKADIINRYLPVLQSWPQPWFVTITAKAVPLKSLNRRMAQMIRGFNIITARYRKRCQRGTGIKLIGIRSLESNFNPNKKTYNPHLHIIVANKEMADVIITEWLNLCTDKFTYKGAQKSSPITNREKALIEIIKYGSKIFTEPDVNNKTKGERNRDIYAAALDNILNAMKGLRIFERFGFNLPKEAAPISAGARVAQQFDEWIFDPQSHDWRNTLTDKALSEYIPAPELLALLESRINKELQ
jgi:hypothetical protein